MVSAWDTASVVSEPDARLGRLDAALLVAAGAVVSVGAVVWFGAVLAALMSGERLDGGLSDAIRAATHLHEHVRDPRQAWSDPRQQAALPGPALYWGATTLVLGATLAIGLLVLRLWRSSRDRGRMRLGVETRARFATRRDLAPLVVDRPVPAGRFVLGRALGQLVATEDRHAAPQPRRRRRSKMRRGDRGSVAVIGPSRSGKTANVIAGLLDWEGPAVVVSVKRDLIDATRAARERTGETRVFDPSGVSGIPPDDARPMDAVAGRRHASRRAEGSGRARRVDPTSRCRRRRRLLGEAGRDPARRAPRRSRAWTVTTRCSTSPNGCSPSRSP